MMVAELLISAFHSLLAEQLYLSLFVCWFFCSSSRFGNSFFLEFPPIPSPFLSLSQKQFASTNIFFLFPFCIFLLRKKIYFFSKYFPPFPSLFVLTSAKNIFSFSQNWIRPQLLTGRQKKNSAIPKKRYFFFGFLLFMSQKPTPPKGGGRLTQRANSLRHHSLITLEVSGEKKNQIPVLNRI